MIHPGNVDGYRHKNGVFNDRVLEGVKETDRFIGELMAAVEEAGLADCTNFVLTSGHGQIDIKRVMKPNVLLQEAGLLTLNDEGRITDWKAVSQSGGTCAMVYLKDPSDRETYEKTYKVLKDAAQEGVYGFESVFTEEETREKYHLGGDFSFVLETDGFTSFQDAATRPIVTTYQFDDYRYGKATHGHLPEKGPQPIFSAKGPAFRDGVTIERANLVDEAPTFAKVLGAELKDADGIALEQLLR